jgi:hypothetical protein
MKIKEPIILSYPIDLWIRIRLSGFDTYLFET